MYDTIIVGMGIAGISAGIYAKQANKNVLLLEGSAPGGLLNNIDSVKNFAGFTDIKGPDFAFNLYNQVVSNDIEFKLEEVINIEVTEEGKKVITKNGEYLSKSVIIATGRRPKLLGLENEKELLGRGVSTCAICDGNLYKGKDVAVVGAGNSALQEALYLANVVNKVYILMRRSIFAGSPELVDKVKNHPSIEVVLETSIKSINQEDGVFTNLTLNNDNILEVSGLFVYAGYSPDVTFAKDLDITNLNGYIEVDDNLETKVKGIFAIGDVTKKDIYQLMNAAADGARVIGKLPR
ncbi:MAG: FAD-dependent oxidoreductase [bacterium]